MTIAKSSKNHARRRPGKARRLRSGAGPRPEKRTPDYSGKPAPSDAMTCTEVLSTGAVCGKKCFRSRREVKSAAAILYPGQRMRFYTCGGWHHMTSVDSVRSEQTRRELAASRGVFDEPVRQRPARWPGQPKEET